MSMGMEMTVREVRKEQEADIADIAALERRIFPDPWTEKGIGETLSQRGTVVLGIWKGSAMAGYVILYSVPDEGEIARIAVEPSFRRQGAAGCLLKELAKLCAERGIARLMLEVREGNAAAVSFYKKNGFTEDGRRKGYYSNPCEDAILMSLVLENAWQA